MARYSLRRPTYEDIPRLQYFEQVEGKGTEIGLVLKSEDEWKHVIDTYEYFKVSEGEKVAVIGSVNLYVTELTE